MRKFASNLLPDEIFEEKTDWLSTYSSHARTRKLFQNLRTADDVKNILSVTVYDAMQKFFSVCKDLVLQQMQGAVCHNGTASMLVRTLGEKTIPTDALWAAAEIDRKLCSKVGIPYGYCISVRAAESSQSTVNYIRVETEWFEHGGKQYERITGFSFLDEEKAKTEKVGACSGILKALCDTFEDDMRELMGERGYVGSAERFQSCGDVKALLVDTEAMKNRIAQYESTLKEIEPLMRKRGDAPLRS